MITLPTKPKTPEAVVEKSTTLIYGPPKVGKSTFCSQAPSPVFFATEPGLNALATCDVDIRNWEEFKQACAAVHAGNHDFKTVIIDTIDNAHEMCREHVLAENNLTHEQDASFGKAYAMINNEFRRVINHLVRLPYGVIMVSHSKEVEIDSRQGKYTKSIPTLPRAANEFICGLVDFVFFCEICQQQTPEGEIVESHVVRTKPSRNYEAGDRYKVLPENFALDYGTFDKALTTGRNQTKKGNK